MRTLSPIAPHCAYERQEHCHYRPLDDWALLADSAAIATPRADGWNEAAANVVCQQLGYAAGVVPGPDSPLNRGPSRLADYGMEAGMAQV